MEAAKVAIGMKWFTGIWYVLMAIWVVGGAGFGTLNYAWILLVPLAYWVPRFLASRKYTRIWNVVAIGSAGLMVVVLLLAVVDVILSSLPPTPWIRY